MALLQPDTARIGHPPGRPAEDRFPEELVSGTPRDLREALMKLIGPDQVLYRAIDLVRYASDASPYRLIPQVVVAPRHIDDVLALLKYCRENGRHATFRAAGTSLCGQAQSDDILIDVRKHWYGMSLEDGGLALRPAWRHSRARQRLPAQTRTASGAGPGEHQCVHDRRRRRQ